MRGCDLVYPLSDKVSLRIQFFAPTDAEIDLERVDRAVRGILPEFIQRIEKWREDDALHLFDR
jgi:translation elongation factor EF-1beta